MEQAIFVSLSCTLSRSLAELIGLVVFCGFSKRLDVRDHSLWMALVALPSQSGFPVVNFLACCAGRSQCVLSVCLPLPLLLFAVQG